MRKPRHRLIMGKHCVQELLKHAPDRLVAVYTSQGDDPIVSGLMAKSIPVHHVTKKELKALVDSESHQSFVAAVHERPTRTLKEFLRDIHKNKSLVLALDSVEDPHNLGAILRAAECFGVDAVVYSKNRGTDITPVASKASVGASELMEILKVSNLADALRKFQDEGYTLVAADASPSAQSLPSYGFSNKTLLIMGAEGKGIQPLILKMVDDVLYIPMKGHISSLNVSQATAVILSTISLRQS